ncbi:MAG: hypothetical protein FWG32_05315 [Oscillospiraceae bacterium]|nr:hypothetical protein [Oscillospiraceae bacterium]
MSFLISTDDLERALKSEILSDAVAGIVINLLRSEKEPEQFCNLLPDGTIDRLEEELCIRIQVAICKFGLPLVFTQKGGEIAGSVLAKSAIGKAIAGKAINLVSKPMARELEEYIIDDGHDIILKLMDHELRRIAGRPINELSDVILSDDEDLKCLVKSLWAKFTDKNAHMIAECIDKAMQ